MSSHDEAFVRSMLDEMARRSARLTALAGQAAEAVPLDARRVHAALRGALRDGFLAGHGPACTRCGFPAADGRCDLCGGLRSPQPATDVAASSESGRSASEGGTWPGEWAERLSAFVSAIRVGRAPSVPEPTPAGPRRRRPRKSPPGARAADGTWTCTHCGHFNSAKARVCFECGYAAPAPPTDER